jgi:hypothetical protein
MAAIDGSDHDIGHDLWQFLDEVSRQLGLLLQQPDHRYQEPDFIASNRTKEVAMVDEQLPITNQASGPHPSEPQAVEWKLGHRQMFQFQERTPIARQEKMLDFQPPEMAQAFNEQVQQVGLKDSQQHGDRYYYHLQQMQQQQPQEQLNEQINEFSNYYQQQYQLSVNQTSVENNQTLIDCAYCNWIARHSQMRGPNYMDST